MVQGLLTHIILINVLELTLLRKDGLISAFTLLFLSQLIHTQHLDTFSAFCFCNFRHFCVHLPQLRNFAFKGTGAVVVTSRLSLEQGPLLVLLEPLLDNFALDLLLNCILHQS